MSLINGELKIDALAKYCQNPIEVISYVIYVDNGGLLEPHDIIAEGIAEAEDGKMSSTYEYISINPGKKISGGRYILIITVNGAVVSERYNIIVDKSGNIIKDIIKVTSFNKNTFNCSGDNLTQNRYSYVVFRIISSTEKIFIKEGVVYPIKEYGGYSLDADLGMDITSGTYKIQFYKESLSEINGNYDEYTCINDSNIIFKPE